MDYIQQSMQIHQVLLVLLLHHHYDSSRFLHTNVFDLDTMMIYLLALLE